MQTGVTETVQAKEKKYDDQNTGDWRKIIITFVAVGLSLIVVAAATAVVVAVTFKRNNSITKNCVV